VKLVKFIVIFFINILLFNRSALAQDMVAELALFQTIPTVITPAKKKQPITESPTAIYVVTQQDIKESGSVHIWDALRQVPGLDVASSSIGQPDVSVRGFNNTASNKTLVLIDGRSIYLPIEGFMFWETIPVQMEEIDRIEVIKGPVAALYGANANLGLINIITKKPDSINGGSITNIGGSLGTNKSSFVYRNKNDKFGYKISGGWAQANEFEKRLGIDTLDTVKTNFLTEYAFNEETKLSVSGGLAKTDHQFFTNRGLLAEVDSVKTYSKVDFEWQQWTAKVYWNHFLSHFDASIVQQKSELDTVDAELSYSFKIGKKHDFIAGGGGRFNNMKSNIFGSNDDGVENQSLWNVFIQDDFRAHEKLLFNFAARIDDHPLTDINPSARVAVNYLPNTNDVYRLATGYSFRNPTLSETNLDLTLSPNGVATSRNQGNEGLDSEVYLTVEASYEGRRLNGRFRPFMTIFWTRIEDFIERFGAGGGPFGLDNSHRNINKAYLTGGEFGGEYDLRKGLTVLLNYALNHVEYGDDENSNKYFHPKHKVNGGVKTRFLDDKLSTRLLVHFVSGSETSIAVNGKIPPYVNSSFYLDYKIQKNVEISFSVLNLLHDKHQELPGGSEVGTRFLGGMTFKF